MDKPGSYGVSPERGFLSPFDPAAITMSACLQAAQSLAATLPERLVAGDLREAAMDMAEPSEQALLAVEDLRVLRTSLVHYTFLAQSYVWSGEPTPQRLPSTIARPLWLLAKRVGQPPILTYSQYVLDNWAKLDADGAIDLANTRMIQPFLGGQDEAWFVLIHVAIEAAAGPMLCAIPKAIEASNNSDTEGLTAALGEMVNVWEPMLAAFDRMPERCDPYVYFHRVRPWIHGFKDNPALPDGIVYEGVADEPRKFRGQTGSQSSIVPAMDAFLQVGHGHDPLRGYLDELHEYRLPEHRKFIDDIRAGSRVRQVVKMTGKPALTEAYNDCLEQLTKFRTRHLQYAASYIHKQSRGGRGNASDVGTGGTPFMKYLKKHRDEAEAHRL